MNASTSHAEPRTPRFFFVHVQKTAGTALWRRLHEQFEPHELYPGPGDGEPPEAVLSVTRLCARWRVRRAELRVVTGHFPLCTVELLDAPFTTLTLLRDPVERTLSQLRHHRQTTPADAERPLEAIYEDPVRFELVHNHLVKMFSLTVDEMTDGVLTPIVFSQERLARAKARLDTVGVVGFQERFDSFCVTVSERFGWDLGRSIYMNRTQPVPVPDAFRARIAADNADDLELYEYARERYCDT